jgi:NAD(P)-dependent dehydrogenase (short-subunit alcohol dehydrogenase family)
MAHFEGKVAVVTGGGSGIGLEVAVQLAGNGAAVALADVNSDLAATAARLRADGANVIAVQCDVSVEADAENLIATTVAQWGRLDVVVNSAGIAAKGLVHQIDTETWDRVLAVNLTGSFLVSRAAVQSMIAHEISGSIVNLASVDAHAAERNEVAYNVSKAGVLALTRTFAVELGSVGIRVNSVSPGYVLTPMTLAGAASDPTIAALLRSENFERVPLRRGLRPSEISEAVCFLASDAASGITGQDLIVDGGLLADAYLVSAMRSQVGRPDTARPTAG